MPSFRQDRSIGLGRRGHLQIRVSVRVRARVRCIIRFRVRGKVGLRERMWLWVRVKVQGTAKGTLPAYSTAPLGEHVLEDQGQGQLSFKSDF